MGYASSLFNMVITTAAAFGVSTVSNMLTSHEQIHQTNLGQHFSVFEAWRLSLNHRRMPGSPHFDYLGQMISGQHQQLGMLYGTIQAQAWLLSYNDVYRLMAVVLILVAPCCLLLRRAGAGGSSVMSH
jgi:DHA2 family multidrug resistance protein